MLSKEQREEFERLAKPLIQWINENFDPHAKVIVDQASAEIMSGESGFHTDEFIKD